MTETRPTGWAGELHDLYRRISDEYRARTGTRMTVRAIAAAADLSVGHVSQVVNGRSRPSPETAASIARALGAAEADQAQAHRYAQLLAETSDIKPAPYVLEPLAADHDPAQQSLSAGDPIGALLDVRHSPIAFTGRERELAQLRRWRDSAEPAGTLLVHGPGGQGKTRLGRRFAQLSTADGWRSLTAARSDATGAATLAPIMHVRDDRPILIIVDYAERWPAPDLVTLLATARNSRPPIRYLLLARPAAALWDTAAIVEEELELQPLAQTPADRIELYHAAAETFAATLGISATPPPFTGGPEFREVLTIHMAALVAVDAAARSQPMPTGLDGLSAYLIDRERDYWQSLYDSTTVQTPPVVMGRSVFAAALVGPTPADAGVDVLSAMLVHDPATAIADHRRCYPGPDPAAALTPIYPDRLAEDFLALQVPSEPGTGDPWSLSAVQQLVGDARAAAYSPRGVATLVEAARRWPHLAHRVLGPLLHSAPEAIIAAGGTVLIRLADINALDKSALDALSRRFPAPPHAGLDIGMAAVTERLVQLHQETAEPDPQAAALYHSLVHRLSQVGRYEDAANAAHTTIDLLTADSSTNHYDHACVLHDLAMQHAFRDRPGRALTAAQQALDRLASTAEPRDDRDQLLYARILNTQAIILGALDRPDEAFDLTQHTVATLRTLTKRSAAPKRLLAVALNNLSVDLSARGDHASALAATAEAVQVCEPLYATDPDTAAADYAMSLTNYAIQSIATDHTSDAVPAAEQALSLYRTLAETNPAASLIDVAWTLSIVAWARAANLTETADVDRVLDPANESIDLYQSFEDPVPLTFSDERYSAIRETAMQLDQHAHAEHATALRARIAG